MKNIITLNDPSWYITAFDYEVFSGEEVPLVISKYINNNLKDNYWDDFDHEIYKAETGGYEIRNTLIRNNNEFNFIKYNYINN
jgi:hypothetical protein